MLVPLIGLEPIRYYYQGILSPSCLPIPPQRRENKTVYILHIILLFIGFVNAFCEFSFGVLLCCHRDWTVAEKKLRDRRKSDRIKRSRLIRGKEPVLNTPRHNGEAERRRFYSRDDRLFLKIRFKVIDNLTENLFHACFSKKPDYFHKKDPLGLST